MKLVFTESAWNDYLWFQENDRRLLKRINTLIKEAMRTPYLYLPFNPMSRYETLMEHTSSYANLEIRILKKEVAGYPIEFTLDGRQQFRGGYLSPDQLPWIPGPSPTQDGERLFNWLFTDFYLREQWGNIRGQQSQCRIRLRITASAPELHAIPWELLRDATPTRTPQTLAASTATPFSRYIASEWFPPGPIAERPIKLLVVIANPNNLYQYKLNEIKVDREQAIIQDALAMLTPDQLDLTFLDEPITLPVLADALKTGYHILHLVAHGRFSKRHQVAVLYLANDNNQVNLVTEAPLAELLKRQVQTPYLIFLASCQSAIHSSADAFRGFAPSLITAGVPVVLAMQDAVPIKTAQAFTHSFYRQLFQHGQVDLASNQARNDLITADFPGSSIPILFSRLPDNQLFDVSKFEPPEPLLPFEPETVYIPAGPFLMGSDTTEGVESPQHMVDLPAYWIGKYPVTNEQYAEFIRQTGRPVGPAAGWDGQRPPPGKDDHPVKGVTWNDAMAYCEWLTNQTKRRRQYSLPSEAEWEKAARGTDGRIYPWGNEWEPDRCNHSSRETKPVTFYPPQYEHINGAQVFDMVGNAREWTSTRWGVRQREPDPQFLYPWANDEREDLTFNNLVLRVCRGGGAVDPVSRLRCSARYPYFPDQPGPPQNRHGFRVVLRAKVERNS